jgi:hypothetical protein
MGHIIGIKASSILKTTIPVVTDYAQAFIDATGITDTTQKNAIIALVSDLQTYGIWDKMKAIYPFVGGTATTHKFNLKNAVDYDSAFRLSYYGGLTHSSNGVVGDGTGYIDTHLNALSNLVNNDVSFSFYSRTNTTAGAYSSEMSLIAGSYVSANWLTLRINNKASGNAYFAIGDDNVPATVSSTAGNGFFIGNEIANNDRKLIRNDVVIATNTTTDNSALPNYNVSFFGASFSNKSTNQCAFASIGSGLTGTELTNFKNIIQTYQTSLGRNV